MLGIAITMVLIGIFSPVVGKLVDRFGGKYVIIIGAIVSVLGFLSLVFVQTVIHFIFSYIIIGIGGSAISAVPATAIVAESFTEKRGLAMGIMSTGVGIGGFIVTSLLGNFIIPHFGWKAGYITLACLNATTIPLTFFMLETRKHIKTDNIENVKVNDGVDRRKRIFSATAAM